jgi:hypothetical protein
MCQSIFMQGLLECQMADEFAQVRGPEAIVSMGFRMKRVGKEDKYYL